MIILDQIRNFIQNLTHKEFIKWASVYIGIVTLGLALIIIRHVMVNSDLSAKLIQLNKSRSKIQQIFTEFNVIQGKKTELDELLKKNKNFNIQKYFQDLSGQHRLQPAPSVRFASEKLPNGYIQESLMITLSNITTKQLCDLMTSIEQQPLVHINFVDITHQPSTSKITVSMTIATLRAEE